MSSAIPALEDIFSVVVESSLFNQQILNKYWFQVTDVVDGPATADLTWQIVWDDFKVEYMRPLIRESMGFTHAELTVVKYSYRNEFDTDPREFVDEFPDTGDVLTGDCMPPFVSLGWRLNRPYAGLRHGYKRYAGVPEAYCDGETFTLTGTPITQFVDAFMTPYVGTNLVAAHTALLTIKPVYIATFSPSNVGPAVVQGLSGPKLGSQNTRKIGRGS